MGIFKSRRTSGKQFGMMVDYASGGRSGTFFFVWCSVSGEGWSRCDWRMRDVYAIGAAGAVLACKIVQRASIAQGATSRQRQSEPVNAVKAVWSRKDPKKKGKGNCANEVARLGRSAGR